MLWTESVQISFYPQINCRSEVKTALWSEDTKVWPMPVEVNDQMKIGECTKFLLTSTRKLDAIYDKTDSK